MNKKLKLSALIILILIIVIGLKLFLGKEFSSVEDFQNYLESFGIAGPLFLTLFQAFQVVVPVLPGYFGCAAGAIAFGTLTGFICNYVGISAGSIIAYFLARKYGSKILELMFSKKQIRRWTLKVRKAKSYNKYLFISILLPLFPDDFLCYFSGVIKQKKSTFIWIVILAKPWCILVYSILFGMIK